MFTNQLIIAFLIKKKMNKSKYLVIGSKGLLGSEIIKVLKFKKRNYYTAARKNSDLNINLKNFSKLKKFILKHNLIISLTVLV